jgi:repressor LexA
MGRKKLLAKEEVLAAIQRFLTEHGMPPTIEELRHSLKVGSTRTVLRYLQHLEQEGMIERWSGARGLKTKKSQKVGAETVAIPLVGTAPAGPLMFAEQNIEGWIRLPREIAKSGHGFFLLRVRGHSMNQAVVGKNRIENGDLVLVRKETMPDPGRIVVALIDGEATIKRLARAPDYWILKPESDRPGYEAIILKESAAIQGVVTDVLKRGSDLFGSLQEH